MPEEITETIWQRIESEYINGNLSMQELACKYGLHGDAVRSRARRGGWTQKRKEQRQRVEERSAALAAETIAQTDADRAAILHRVMNKTAALLEARVDYMAQYPDMIRVQDIKAVADATRIMQDMIPASVTKEDEMLPVKAWLQAIDEEVEEYFGNEEGATEE